MNLKESLRMTYDEANEGDSFFGSILRRLSLDIYLGKLIYLNFKRDQGADDSVTSLSGIIEEEVEQVEVDQKDLDRTFAIAQEFQNQGKVVVFISHVGVLDNFDHQIDFFRRLRAQDTNFDKSIVVTYGSEYPWEGDTSMNGRVAYFSEYESN